MFRLVNAFAAQLKYVKPAFAETSKSGNEFKASSRKVNPVIPVIFKFEIWFEFIVKVASCKLPDKSRLVNWFPPPFRMLKLVQPDKSRLVSALRLQ